MEPGDAVTVKTVTEPDAVVLLSVVDKSLSLLAEACKSLEKDNVSFTVIKNGLIIHENRVKKYGACTYSNSKSMSSRYIHVCSKYCVTVHG